MLIVDAHLDLAYNAIANGRNLLQPLDKLRQSEKKEFHRGRASVTFPALLDGGVRLCFGTLFVFPVKKKSDLESPFGQSLSYQNADEAHQRAMLQLDYYHRLADENDHIRLVTNIAALDEVVNNPALIGIVPLMEGADPIREPEEAELWYERGLRLIGLAWDDTRYSGGAWPTSERGGLTTNGRKLLDIMADLGCILDLTHMSEKAALQALDHYDGAIVATHCNARALVSGERQLSDTQIRLLGERDGVIGSVFYNSFLLDGYKKGDEKTAVTLAHAVNHIDHICQLLGSAAHVGIGSDFDGGFGADDIPAELDSAADLPKLAIALRERGYTDENIADIMGGNWLRLLRRAWRY